MSTSIEALIERIRSHLERAEPKEMIGRMVVEFTEDEEFEYFAPILNHIDTPDPNAEPFHEKMSDAFIWSDELFHIHEEICYRSPLFRSLGVHGELTSFMRPVFHYRTCLICSDSDVNEACKDQWERVLEISPKWIGFLPERRQPDRELAERREKESKKFIRRMDAWDRLYEREQRKKQQGG